MTLRSISAALAASFLCAAGCGGDDDGGGGGGDSGGDGQSHAFCLRIENVGPVYDLVHAGTFDTGVGADAPGPIGPGGAFEVSFTAGRGARLSFATMFAESNDFFFAPDGDGIPLYDDAGAPIAGDVTDRVALWDVGTEMNQEPGLGPDQAPRQEAPDQGSPDPDPRVRPGPDSFGNLPPVADVIRVTLTPGADQSFRLRIENVSTASTLMTSNGDSKPVPLSPGSFAVHEAPNPLFTVGEEDRGEGLERIAEAGLAMRLGRAVDADEGVTVPLSPGVWIVHQDAAPLFAAGESDRGDGLERIAEDGDPAALGAALANENAGVFDTAVGASAAGPIMPGQAFEVELTASPGDRLSFATMFAQSNDVFFAPTAEGIALFDGDEPVAGDVTDAVSLWDVGTEENQEPGVGNDQAPRQLAPDTGAADGLPVQTIAERDDGYSYPAASDLIRVTLEP